MKVELRIEWASLVVLIGFVAALVGLLLALRRQNSGKSSTEYRRRLSLRQVLHMSESVFAAR